MHKIVPFILVAALSAARAESDLKLNKARFGHAAVAVGESIYVLGGHINGDASADVEEIAPSRGEVREVARLSMPRMWAKAVSDGTHVYIVGGARNLSDRAQLDIVERWTPGTGEWKTLAPLPEPRASVGLVFHEGRVYAIGGAGPNDKRVATVFIYDPIADAWARGADMPTARETDVAVYNGRIYAAGGYDGKTSLSTFEVYDPAADSWMKLPDLPFELSAHRVAVVSNALYTFGHYHALGRVAAYDFATAEWAILDLPCHPARHTGVAFNGREVFVTGGNFPVTDRIQRFTPDQLAAAPRKELAAALEDEKAAAQARAVGAPPPPPLSPEMKAFIKKWAERLAEIRTLVVDLEHRHEMVGIEVDHEPRRTTFRFNREGPRLRVESHMGETILDGATATIAVDRRRRYFQQPQAEAMEPRSAFAPMLQGLFMPDLQALLAADSISSLTLSARQFRWAPAEPGEGDEPGDWILRGELVMAGRTNRAHTSIDPANGLVRRLSLEMTFRSGSDDDENPVRSFLMKNDRTKTIINEPIPPETFVFTPPENWRRVDTVNELYQSSGRARFELSGKPAPDFNLKLLDGETFTLSAQSGKVVIIDFWATWCGPCVKALPKMQAFWESVQTQDVVVVGVSTDDPDNEDAVRKMVDRHKLTYPNGIDRADIKKDYFVRGIPCVVLIDRNGVVQGRHVGFSSELAQTLREQTEKLLAGESLPSAQPPDEEEDEDFEVPTSHAIRMNARYFETLWETSTAHRAATVLNPYNLVENRQPPAWMVWQEQRRLVAADPKTGDRVAAIELPAETESSSRDRISYAMLRRPGLAPLLVRSQIHTKQEEDENTGRTYHRVVGSTIEAFADGRIVWTQSLSNASAQIQPLQVAPDIDGLLATDFQRLWLYDAEGVLRAVQQISHTSRLIIFDQDDDGVPEFHLIGPRAGAYRLRTGPAPAGAAPASPL